MTAGERKVRRRDVGLKRWQRHSDQIIRTKRWRALRLLALRRDDWRCVECGSRQAARSIIVCLCEIAPDLAFDLNNLQTLCAPCHSRKTRLECGHPELPPAQRAWRDLSQLKSKGLTNAGISEDRSPTERNPTGACRACRQGQAERRRDRARWSRWTPSTASTRPAIAQPSSPRTHERKDAKGELETRDDKEFDEADRQVRASPSCSHSR